MSKTFSRRLERLGARETPNPPRVLKILVTRIGSPGYVTELVLDKAPTPAQPSWQRNRECAK